MTELSKYIFQDHGNSFTYTGSGGRDLSGNKRTAEQSCDQKLTNMNRWGEQQAWVDTASFLVSKSAVLQVPSGAAQDPQIWNGHDSWPKSVVSAHLAPPPHHILEGGQDILLSIGGTWVSRMIVGGPSPPVWACGQDRGCLCYGEPFETLEKQWDFSLFSEFFLRLSGWFSPLFRSPALTSLLPRKAGRNLSCSASEWLT